MRDAKHFRDMLDCNPEASIGFTLAASAVYASLYGACEAEHHSTAEWKTIARDLKLRYGEQLTAAELRAEMKPKRGAPQREGVLIRVPCRFENREQYESAIAHLRIDQRGEILYRESQRERRDK